jgi:Thiopeptide-type bacteriocin precursor
MDHEPDDLFDLDDLDLGMLSAVGMRDSVALPETGASGMLGWGSSSCSCCYQEQLV